MKIGELARLASSNAETIRYYESIGLLPKPPRTSGNYRDYGHAHAERLAFIRQARGLGFELEAVRALLRLADDPGRDCGEADRIASGHLAAVDEKIHGLRALRTELQRIIEQCRGGQVAKCKIIEALSNHEVRGRKLLPGRLDQKRSQPS